MGIIAFERLATCGIKKFKDAISGGVGVKSMISSTAALEISSADGVN
jgi:hypothetical protein